ncbi:TIGR04222 domain-containing membrane protein [Streptomyces sp. NBC_01102]|uniref:TIGR04222 domain-containing membrane protein n=1 Tax=unclassified Streptomyces TaxID=2593676 RepID=UPI003863953C|nr:TIGR04222 domain-containing membrane protein [Streptomyces sp. NBC_01102]
MNALALLLTLAVAVSSTLLIVSTRKAGRHGGGPVYVHDRSEAAFLGGGPARVVDTALTALHTDGRLVIGGPGIVAVQRAEARDVVERAVLQELSVAPSGALHTLRLAVMRHPAVQEIGDGLAARGLMVAPGESLSRRRWALAQGVVCTIAFPVGMVLTFVQYALHEGYADMPFPFIVKVLPALVTGGAVGFLVAASAKARVTRAGRLAADGYRAAHAHIPDPAHLVATVGLRALPDPVLQGQLLAAARHPSVRRPSPSSAPYSPSTDSYATSAALLPVMWCAGAGPGSRSCGSSGGGGHGTGSSCSSGSGCGGGSGGGSGCGGGSGGGSGCGGGSGGGSSCSGGSSCGGGGGSSCSSSSSSCSSSSSGSSCGSSS